MRPVPRLDADPASRRLWPPLVRWCALVVVSDKMCLFAVHPLPFTSVLSLLKGRQTVRVRACIPWHGTGVATGQPLGDLAGGHRGVYGAEQRRCIIGADRRAKSTGTGLREAGRHRAIRSQVPRGGYD